MNRRRFIGVTLGTVGLAGLASRAIPRRLKRVERKSWALGSEISLIAYHRDPATAEGALSSAFQAIDRIEDVLSLYRPESEICRLNRDGVFERPNPDLVTVLRSAMEWSRVTGGAFDPTVQPLWSLHASGKVPGQSELDTARRLVDWQQVSLEPDRIRLAPGQAVTLNGIAQGFAADRIREVFRAHDIQHALVNTGEFGALGRKPEGEAWRIGIQHPRNRDGYIAVAPLEERFLATSGDYETTFSADFASHHIFDPATGRSPTTLASVTVIANSGMEADALSTAIFVLGPGRGLELAAWRPHVDALLVLKSGEVIATPNFPEVA